MDKFCTYTQGYYGNSGGMSCDGENSYTTEGMIAHSLSSYPSGKMVIGLPGRSIYVMNTTADISKVIEYLPGGSGIGVLSAGDFEINSTSFKNLYVDSKKGTINNKLLAQTITLGLNLGINGDLAGFMLESKFLVTADIEGGCGFDTPKVRECVYNTEYPYNLIKVVNDYHYYQIDQSVIDAIEGTKNVAGLFALANKALGQGAVYTNTFLTKIASAVDAINNAFDGCRIFMGYMNEKIVCPSTNPMPPKSASIISSNSLKVFPNPFNEKVTFEFVSGENTHAVLEINNIVGQKLATLFDRPVEKGVLNRVEYQPTNVVSGVLIYRLKLGGSVQTGKVMYKNK
jgi:hypothetical protein